MLMFGLYVVACLGFAKIAIFALCVWSSLLSALFMACRVTEEGVGRKRSRGFLCSSCQFISPQSNYNI